MYGVLGAPIICSGAQSTQPLQDCFLHTTLCTYGAYLIRSHAKFSCNISTWANKLFFIHLVFEFKLGCHACDKVMQCIRHIQWQRSSSLWCAKDQHCLPLWGINNIKQHKKYLFTYFFTITNNTWQCTKYSLLVDFTCM